MKKLRKLIPKKLKKIDRNIMLAGSLSLILLISAGLALAFNNTTTPQTQDEPEQTEVTEIDTAENITTKLTLREGVVEYRTDGIWDTAPTDLEISTGMSVRTTGASGRAVVVFEDGSLVRIGPNSEVRFATLTTARIVIEHNDGHLYNRVVGSEDRAFVVQTRNAQFQSIGTAFRTIASGDEEAVDVFESEVRETTSNLEAKEGEKLIVKSFTNPDKDGTVEKIDIEALKADSFIAWNREQDQQNESFKDALGFLSDFDGPEIHIGSPAPNSTINVNTDSSEGTVTITGKTERGARLTIQSKSQSGSSPVDVTVDDSGNFASPSLSAPLGTSVFEFIATDRVGNKSTLNINYTFIRESTTQQRSIGLSVDDSDPDVLKFGWVLDGLTTPDGVQLVYDSDKGPAYPDDKEELIESGNTAELNVSPKFKSGETYYFRVCRYNDNSNNCDVYSNEVSVNIP